MKYAIVSDFDGTITKTDVGDFLLLHFGLATKTFIEESYAKNEPVEKWMKKNFSTIGRIGRKKVEEAVYRNIKIKKGFTELTAAARKKKIPLEIVSGGVDLYARPVFKKEKIKAKAYFGKCRLAGGKAVLDYSFLKGLELSDFKKSRVIFYQKKGYTVIFCGDAPNDFKAASAASLVFADKRLYKLCREKGVKCRKLLTFLPVLKTISR